MADEKKKGPPAVEPPAIVTGVKGVENVPSGTEQLKAKQDKLRAAKKKAQEK